MVGPRIRPPSGFSRVTLLKESALCGIRTRTQSVNSKTILEPFAFFRELADRNRNYVARRQNNPSARTYARRAPRATAASATKAAREQRPARCEDARRPA